MFGCLRMTSADHAVIVQSKAGHGGSSSKDECQQKCEDHEHRQQAPRSASRKTRSDDPLATVPALLRFLVNQMVAIGTRDFVGLSIFGLSILLIRPFTVAETVVACVQFSAFLKPEDYSVRGRAQIAAGSAPTADLLLTPDDSTLLWGRAAFVDRGEERQAAFRRHVPDVEPLGQEGERLFILDAVQFAQNH